MNKEIHDKIFDEIAPKYFDLTNLSSAGVLKGILEILAESASIIMEHQANVRREAYIDTAGGIALDDLARQIGINRIPPKKTRGWVIFGRNKDLNKSLKIPQNTIIKTKMLTTGKEYRYIVKNETIMPPSYRDISVEVEALSIGAEYNVAPYYIARLVNPVSGIDWIENRDNWIFQYGTNGETNESLRLRYKAKWGELTTGSTVLAYESWTRSVDGVDSVCVFPTPRGYNTVDIIASSIEGILTETKLNEIKRVIDKNKPVGVDVRVMAPIPKIIDIDIILNIQTELLRSEIDLIKEKALEIINAMFTVSPLNIEIFKIGENFVLDKVRQCIMTHLSEVKYIDFITPETNISITKYQVATLGSLEIAVNRNV